jgi:hypothetical protein
MSNDNLKNVELPLNTITKIFNRKIKILKLYPREFFTIIASAIFLFFIIIIVNLINWFFTGSNVILHKAAVILFIFEIMLYFTIKKVNEKYGEDSFFVFTSHFFNSLIYGDFKESFFKFVKKTFPKINNKIIK